MNIYDYFNSHDVADHSKSIGHTFNSLECAAIIFRSENRTLKEKHAAYRTIIDEYPDMVIPQDTDYMHITNLHHALKTIIETENQWLARISSPDPHAVYQTFFHYQTGRTGGAEEGPLFATYEEACKHALKTANAENDKTNSGLKLRYMVIDKTYMSNGGSFVVYLFPTGEVATIWACDPLVSEDPYDWLESMHCESISLLLSCFFDVPVPFKPGDIVEINAFPGRFRVNESGIYVFKDICRDDQEKHKRLLQYGCLNDMTANGYCIRVNHTGEKMVETDTIHFYPDLQFCQRELEDEERILKYISLYAQGKICICSLLKIQRYYLLDQKIRNLKDVKAIMDSADEEARLASLPY